MLHCLQDKNILILEDEVFTGTDIAMSIMDAKGHVFGPIASIEAALNLLKHNSVDAAILDLTLIDGEADPIIDLLVEQNKLVIIHSSSPLPPDILKRHANIQYYHKPTPTNVLRHALMAGLTMH